MIHQNIILIIIVLIVAFLIYNSYERFQSVLYTGPSPQPLATCTPASGVWSVKNADGTSSLQSPCCQPPDYKLAKGMRRCRRSSGEPASEETMLDLNDPIQSCLKNCCDYVEGAESAFSPSWGQMARCGCSLWCYNQSTPHFQKYGTAVHYISGDIAESKTSDSADYIGSETFSG